METLGAGAQRHATDEERSNNERRYRRKSECNSNDVRGAVQPCKPYLAVLGPSVRGRGSTSAFLSPCGVGALLLGNGGPRPRTTLIADGTSPRAPSPFS